MAVSLTDARSAHLYRQALEYLPGGVNSPVRSMRAIGRDPLFIDRGDGAEIIDVDGNRYVDWVMSWGPLIHGHAHPEIVAAVTATAQRGTTFGAPTKAEITLAEEVATRIPSVEMLRMTTSGTEATMSALRLARAVTGRDKVLKFAGVPAAATQATVVVPWNDPEALRVATAEHELAAIIAEPFPANMGVVPSDGGFLELLRERADANGALLVFDEVITGFRVARGGAQELCAVLPDLTIMGKVLGGGLPAAAFGGSDDLMQRIAPAGDVYQAGTLSGNPLAVAAGITALSLLDDIAYPRLASTTNTLAEGLLAAADGGPVQVASVPGLITVFFSEQPVRDFAGASACDLEAYAAWCRALLARGVYAPPSQFEAWFVSLAHGERDLEWTLEAAAAAFAEIW
jgi:glutamate-1-semialdehyde 2,1-aminomutase